MGEFGGREETEGAEAVLDDYGDEAVGVGGDKFGEVVVSLASAIPPTVCLVLAEEIGGEGRSAYESKRGLVSWWRFEV